MGWRLMGRWLAADGLVAGGLVVMCPLARRNPAPPHKPQPATAASSPPAHPGGPTAHPVPGTSRPFPRIHPPTPHHTTPTPCPPTTTTPPTPPHPHPHPLPTHPTRPLQVAGYTVSFAKGLTYATVKGAGHMVPQSKPREALAMLDRFISGQPLHPVEPSAQRGGGAAEAQAVAAA